MLNKPKYSLLYVEDEATTREMVVDYLDEFFTSIYEARDGEEGLVLYDEKKPDIIITDIEMPKINGLKFASLIRKRDEHTPIIITTAYTSVEYLLEATELNLIKYLVKPIKEERLEEALESCFEKIEGRTPSVVRLTDKYRYDTLNHILTFDGALVSLTSSQRQLLDLLIQNKNRAVTYREIENYIWYDKVMSDSALRSLVYDIRKLIGKNSIENVSKTGYRINLYE